MSHMWASRLGVQFLVIAGVHLEVNIIIFRNLNHENNTGIKVRLIWYNMYKLFRT